MKKPSLDDWLREAKNRNGANGNGMYLFHNGVVRSTSRLFARGLSSEKYNIKGMNVSYKEILVQEAQKKTELLPGVSYVRVWINSGHLCVGDDIMLVLVGGDTRPNVINALETLVDELKNRCITEEEL